MEMATETTPLTEDLTKQALGSKEGQEVTIDLAKQALESKEGQEMAMNLIKDNAEALTDFVKSNIDTDKMKEVATEAASEALTKMKTLSDKLVNGDMHIRVMAILAAVFVLVTSLSDIFIRMLTLHFVNAVIDVYTAFFCLIVISIETNENDVIAFAGSMIRSIHAFMAKNFQIFDYITGRGAFYFFIGTLKVTQHGLLSLISGILMSVTGLMYCYFGYRAAKMMKASHSEIKTEEDLKSLFDTADADSSGHIDLEEYKCLIQILGIALNKRETELAFMLMDKDGSGTIGFDEFSEFWNSSKNGGSSLSLLV